MGFSSIDAERLSRGRSPRAEYEARLTPGWFWGRPTLVDGVDIQARLGEQLICRGTLTVYLPRVLAEHVGLAVTVCNVGGGTITVRPQPGATIAGSSTFVIDQPYDQVLLSAPSPDLWLSRLSASGTLPLVSAEKPLWEWNGSDLTQFGTITKGSGVTYATASVVSLYGRSWVQIEHRENFGVGSYDANKCSCLPIANVWGTANYRIEALIGVRLYPTGLIPSARYGLTVRMDTSAGSTTPGVGIVALQQLSNGVSPQFAYLFSATSATVLRGAGSLDVCGPSVVEHFTRHSLGARDSTLIASEMAGHILHIGTGSSPSDGDAGLIAYATGSTGPAQILWSEIRVWPA